MVRKIDLSGQDPNLYKFNFDAAKLAQRYREERDKRLNPKGNDQYIYIDENSRYASMLVDPWVKHVKREPVKELVTVLVLGGGFSGIMCGAKLREAGINDFRIIEKGGDFGGTWYWNRYPGAACDSEAYCYLPFLEETGYIPPEKYARAPIILEHCNRMGKKWNLYEKTLFQTECYEIRWQPESSTWLAKTQEGDEIRARFVVSAAGPLHKPKLPGVPGIESYKGHSFHTSRWDYAYTGGNSYGNLDKLSDKTVAIIGTGATAIQCVPHLGRWAKHLYVFQRTPSTVDIRAQQPTDPEWAKSLKPGWQKERDLNFTAITSADYREIDEVDDGWTRMYVDLFALLQNRKKSEIGRKYSAAELYQLADFRHLERLRARVDEIVKDKATAEALKPWYNLLCKRPTFSDEYLPTFNRPNVTLVDTNGKGIDAITEKGIVYGGKEYPVDCIIWGTGFEVGTSWKSRNGFEALGKGGMTIADKWKDGVATMYGMLMNGFPNYFLLQTGQAGAAVNFPRVFDDQSTLAVYVISECVKRGVKEFEVTPEAENGWIKECESKSLLRKDFSQSCTPGYYNLEGETDRLLARNGAYGAGPMVYRDILIKWMKEGNMKGLELRKEGQAAARL